jgi:hypothetical protein
MENSPPPITWDSSYQGYVAKSYNYFSTDSYSNKLSMNRWKILLTERLLWATFIVINLLIPTLFISKGKQIVTCDVKYLSPYRAAATIITAFNFFYTLVTLSTLFSPTTPGYPSALDCFIAGNRHRCIIPKGAIFYDVSIGILVTKATILPIAVLVELILAIYYVTKRSRVSSTCSSELLPYSDVQRTRTVCCFIMRVFTLWQILIFVQIMVGSVSIPFLILLLVSPAQSILLSVELIALIVSISGCLFGIPLPSRCTFNVYSCMKRWFLYVENLLIMAVILVASTTYCLIVKEGISMGSVKGYVLSLIPTIPISIFIWMIQERIRRKKNQLKKRELYNIL